MAIKKVINSSTQQFEPVLVDKLVLDAVPTVNSFNSVTSDAVARAVAGASGEVPQVTSDDNGKVLTAVYDEGGAAVEWAEAQGGGSSYTAGDGIDIDNDEISIDNTVALKTDIPSKGSLMVTRGTTQKELYDAWVAGWTIQSNHGNDTRVYELDNFDYEFGKYTAVFKHVYFGETLVYEDSFSINGLASSTSAVSFGTETTKTSNRVPSADSQTVGKVLTIKSVPDDDPIASWESPATGSLMVKSGTTQKELYDAWVAGWTIQSNHGNEINVYELTMFDYDFGEYAATFKRVNFGESLVYEESFTINGLASSTSAVSFGTKTTKTSNRVPSADSQTVGKVLTIKSVPYEDPIASWESPQLPEEKSLESTNNTISITEGTTTVSIDVANPIPAYDTTTDLGKVLQVTANGLAWVSLT